MDFRVNYTIVFVASMARSVVFYRDVVGLPVKLESPGWTEFATAGSTFALHSTEDERPAPDDPRKQPPGRCRPGFSVPDLDAFHQRMLDHDVPCVQEPEELFGVRIAQYVDPDGLALSVSEAS